MLAQLPSVLRHLHLASGVPDAQLLERFSTQRDEAAFELLVWRHGGMVLRTCRRLLRDAHEAEDAFQATFLALARRADSVGRGSVGGWLYQVAYRVALRARARRARWEAREQPADRRAGPPDPLAEAGRREDRRVLDDEVNRLPEKYRVAFVLCCLEGHSSAEAARALGCPVGTVESRLARARRRLRAGLTRQGMAPACVPAALVATTARAAPWVAAGQAAPAGLVSANVAAL